MNYPQPMPTPRENAKCLDNVRLNKFITEFQQMMNVAMASHGAQSHELLVTKAGKPYGTKSHINHPCTVWVRKNRSNFLHMTRSLLEYYKEHIGRGGSGHENVVANVKRAMMFASRLPAGARTPFPNCAASEKLGIDYKHIEDVHEAYRLYYADRWNMDKKEPKWGY